MNNKIEILFIDDDENLYIVYNNILKNNISEPFIFDHVNSADHIETKLLSKKYDIVILDQKLDNGNKGLDFLPIIKKNNIYTYVIVNSAYGSEILATEAIRKGANDYVKGNKDDNEEFLNVIKQAIEHVKKSKDIEILSNNFLTFNKKMEEKLMVKIQKTKEKVNYFARSGKLQK